MKLNVRIPSSRWWRPVLLVAGLGLAAVELRGHLPSPSATWAALQSTTATWVLIAAVLQVSSLAAFSEQQRQLLLAFGVRMRIGASIALTYARSAIAGALPAGTAVSAGYAFQQFRARGATEPVAGAVMVLSAVASLAGLAVLYAGTSFSIPVLAAIAAALTVAGWAAGRLWPATPADGEPGRVRRFLLTIRSLRVREWLRVTGLAVVNWLCDLGCLIAALNAVGLHLPAGKVATAYLVTQLVRQIPLTPGGLGVIEASLIVALTTAGAAAAPAAAGVLIYRLLSFWSVLPVGLICWTAVKKPARHGSLTELLVAPASVS